MSTLIQTIAAAIAAGAVYGLLGAGFSLAYRTTGIVNFAHGDVAMLGAYVTYSVFASGAPLVVAALAGVLAGGVAGAAMERVVLRPLYGRPLVAGILATVGVSVVLQSAIQLVWGSVPLTLPTLASSTPWHIGSVAFSPAQLVLLLVTIAVSTALVLSIDRTRVGRGMRACAQDSEVVVLFGISPQRLYLLAFTMAGMLAGLAGALITPTIGLTPTRGVTLSVLGFAAAVLGGLGSVTGAIVGGILIAILRNIASVYVSAAYADAVAYVAIVLVLLVRVRGLMGDNLETVRRV
jgi:branched-chain amino acid transport system permease protein